MNHPDSDTLLKYALETLEPAESSGIETHLASCGDCRTSLGAIRSDIALISGLKTVAVSEAPRLPSRRRTSFNPLLRFAAVLVAGFLAGYAISETSRPGRVTIVPQRFEPSPAAVAADRFTTCDVIDVASSW